MKTQEIVLKTLINSSVPMEVSEISEQIGIDNKEVVEALTALIELKQVKSPKYRYYVAR